MQIRSVLVIAITATALIPAAPTRALAQTSAAPAQSAAPKVPPAELNAAKAIGAAPDAAAQVDLAAAFTRTYPNSTLTHQVAMNVSIKVADVADPAQKVALAQKFRAAFPAAAESDLVALNIVDAELKLDKPDDAFRDGADFLTRHPNDLGALTSLTFAGADQAKRRNAKYLADSERYGLKAIAIIESDQKPEGIGDAPWTQYKTKGLALLYQALGVCSLVGGKADEATSRLTKSAALNATDPSTFLLLASTANQEYQGLSEKYKAAAAGPAKDDALKVAYASLDRVIDAYAHVVGLTEGDAASKAMHDAILDDLTSFYKVRHQGTDGLQALIDKYKKTPGGL